MAEIEVDYLVVGAGASGMAFVDTLVAECGDAEVLLVDRRYAPGGHWLDAYPFVRLHQPSATYGVASRRLGDERIDEWGPNAGFYERATAAEIVAYFDKVLEEVLLPSGVRFLGMVEHRGGDGRPAHVRHSLLAGEETTVRVRRRLVDATYTESSIPSTHTPEFTIGDGAVVVPPNDLVRLEAPASGYTVIGGGKTAMDTCGWLLEIGVDPGRIRWVRSRDGWYFNRAFTQPLEQVGSFMQLQARWVAAAAAAENGQDFAHRLEADEVFLRIDPAVEPQAFRGATVSTTRSRRWARSRTSCGVGASATSAPTESPSTTGSCRPAQITCMSTAPPPGYGRRRPERCSSRGASRSSTSRSGSYPGAQRPSEQWRR